MLENNEKIKSLNKEIESFRKEKEVETNENLELESVILNKRLSEQTQKQSGGDRGKI